MTSRSRGEHVVLRIGSVCDKASHSSSDLFSKVKSSEQFSADFRTRFTPLVLWLDIALTLCVSRPIAVFKSSSHFFIWRSTHDENLSFSSSIICIEALHDLYRICARGTSIAKEEIYIEVRRDEDHIRKIEKAHNFMRFRRRISFLRFFSNAALECWSFLESPTVLVKAGSSSFPMQLFGGICWWQEKKSSNRAQWRWTEIWRSSHEIFRIKVIFSVTEISCSDFLQASCLWAIVSCVFQIDQWWK